MDAVIHADEEEASGGLEGVRVPAKEEDGHVVIPVEEDERALAVDDEVSVKELKRLGVNEKLDPETGGERTPVRVGRLQWGGGGGGRGWLVRAARGCRIGEQGWL